LGITLIDKADRDHSFSESWWGWRPTAELVWSSGIINAERMHLIRTAGMVFPGIKPDPHRYDVPDEITAEEAQALGYWLKTTILPRLSPNELVFRDLTTSLGQTLVSSAEAVEGDIGPEEKEMYKTDREELEAFTEFCLASHGFLVL
jgi:hypothetical protein